MKVTGEHHGSGVVADKHYHIRLYREHLAMTRNFNFSSDICNDCIKVGVNLVQHISFLCHHEANPRLEMQNLP